VGQPERLRGYEVLQNSLPKFLAMPKTLLIAYVIENAGILQNLSAIKKTNVKELNVF